MHGDRLKLRGGGRSGRLQRRAAPESVFWTQVDRLQPREVWIRLGPESVGPGERMDQAAAAAAAMAALAGGAAAPGAAAPVPAPAPAPAVPGALAPAPVAAPEVTFERRLMEVLQPHGRCGYDVGQALGAHLKVPAVEWDDVRYLPAEWTGAGGAKREVIVCDAKGTADFVPAVTVTMAALKTALPDPLADPGKTDQRILLRTLVSLFTQVAGAETPMGDPVLRAGGVDDRAAMAAAAAQAMTHVNAGYQTYGYDEKLDVLRAESANMCPMAFALPAPELMRKLEKLCAVQGMWPVRDDLSLSKMTSAMGSGGVYKAPIPLTQEERAGVRVPRPWPWSPPPLFSVSRIPVARYRYWTCRGRRI